MSGDALMEDGPASHPSDWVGARGEVPGDLRTIDPRPQSAGTYAVSPHDLGAEKAVLGALLIDPGAIVEVADLAPDAFYRQGHSRIFEAMRSLYRADQAVDVVTVAAELERTGSLENCGGASYLSRLGSDTPTAIHVAQYARIVADAARSRRLIVAGGRIAELGYARDPEAPTRAAEILAEVNADAAAFGSDIVSRTGARCLAEVTTAPPPAPLLGNLDPLGHTILHGMGGAGKGTLASWWIVGLVRAGHRVLVVDYEGHIDEWSRRIHGLGGTDARAAVMYVSPSSADWRGHNGAIWHQANDLHSLAVEWGATYLVVDSVVPACGATDPLKPEAAGQYARALVAIGLPALSLAHVTKAENPTYPFGSIFWHNLARMSWSLTRAGETVQLVCRKANNYEHLGRFVVSTTWLDGCLSEVALTPYAVVLADRIAEVITSDPLTVAEIVGRLKEDDENEVKPDSVRTALRRGQKIGRFTPTDDRWGLS